MGLLFFPIVVIKTYITEIVDKKHENPIILKTLWIMAPVVVIIQIIEIVIN